MVFSVWFTMPNGKCHRPGAKGNQSGTETSSPGSVHSLCWALSLRPIRAHQRKDIRDTLVNVWITRRFPGMRSSVLTNCSQQFDIRWSVPIRWHVSNERTEHQNVAIHQSLQSRDRLVRLASPQLSQDPASLAQVIILAGLHVAPNRRVVAVRRCEPTASKTNNKCQSRKKDRDEPFHGARSGPSVYRQQV